MLFVTLRRRGQRIVDMDRACTPADRRPSLLLTNDFGSSVADILRRCARLRFAPKSVSEQLDFFHFSGLFSAMAIQVDFDLAMTVVVYDPYRMLDLELPAGNRRLTVCTLFERLFSTGPAMHLGPDTRTVEP